MQKYRAAPAHVALLKQANMGLMNTNAQEHMQAQPCLFHWSWFGRVDI